MLAISSNWIDQAFAVLTVLCALAFMLLFWLWEQRQVRMSEWRDTLRVLKRIHENRNNR